MTIQRFIHKNILYLHIKTFLQRFDAYQHLYQVDILKKQKTFTTECKRHHKKSNDS